MESTINLNLGNEILEGTEVSTNVKQQIIVVPKDRAKLILKEYEEQQKGKIDWISPIALVITIFTTLFTADFKDKVFGLDKGIWQGLFIWLFFLSALWCLYRIYMAATQKCKSLDDVVEELKDNGNIKSLDHQIENLPRLRKWLVRLLLGRKENLSDYSSYIIEHE